MLNRETNSTLEKGAWSRILRMLSLIALGAAVAVGIGFPVAGVLSGGTLRANVAFALVVISVLIALATLLSYGASTQVQRILRAAWLTVAVACLAFTQYVLNLHDPEAHKAADAVLLTVMLGLSFPMGLIALGFAFVYSSLILTDRGVNSLDLLILWSAFSGAGYVQWFKFFPWIIEKRRARRVTKP